MRGKTTGPSPVDRSRPGNKHHLAVDGKGTPLVVRLSAANVPDINELYALVDAIPGLRGRRGHPRQRPRALYADRGYDSRAHRAGFRLRGIRPFIAMRNTEHGSGLGKKRWVVERAIAWLHGFPRLRVRRERRADIHVGLMELGAALICWNQITNALC